ncbi:uncharacterized protein Z520_01257 [Fonsecaea multimorphosa CBS 102226]|uniref:ATPase AAA-type core domain-containing protein n=1 Tax=Fonsecaea multimorphosa CBS 102226 TaxID=1442371 RepID=A0A0D2J099_9EURO|nr:uncharacterized protein Z520_01257 [Fonsecaea multimorphosa CBS 102226]KIY02792.1 hypothetical protein Z520_01257 [Fonsecaea multimorphosa CBS 102226]
MNAMISEDKDSDSSSSTPPRAVHRLVRRVGRPPSDTTAFLPSLEWLTFQVAGKSHVPLYIVSASDLGISPEKIEAGLSKALECCQLWDAILLLDEADVFLEARYCNSLDRNELVSIFHHRLEHYQGLMFLTTNRLSVIDPASKSRLDLVLPYHDPDVPSHRKVWVSFIQKLGPGVTSIGDSDFDELAKEQLNGREIKDLIKTALVLPAAPSPSEPNT